MKAALFAGYGLLTLVAMVLHVISYRKTNDASSKGMALSMVAAVLVGIAVFSTGKDSSGVGAYVTYINGVRMSSGFMTVSTNVFMTLMSAVLSNGVAMGLGWLLGKKRVKTDKTREKPKGWRLAIDIAILYLGIIAVMVVTQARESIPSFGLALGVGIVIVCLGIWRIVDYIIRSRRSGKN